MTRNIFSGNLSTLFSPIRDIPSQFTCHIPSISSSSAWKSVITSAFALAAGLSVTLLLTRFFWKPIIQPTHSMIPNSPNLEKLEAKLAKYTQLFQRALINHIVVPKEKIAQIEQLKKSVLDARSFLGEERWKQFDQEAENVEWMGCAVQHQQFVEISFSDNQPILTIKEVALHLSAEEFREIMDPLVRSTNHLQVKIENSQKNYSGYAIYLFVHQKQFSPQELMIEVPCIMKNKEQIFLTQAELRVLLNYQDHFPESLDFSHIRVETLKFAYEARVNGKCRDTHAYHKHTADVYLRFRNFMDTCHQGSPTKLYAYNSLPDSQAVNGRDRKKIGWDRLDLPENEFKAEMKGLLEYFSQVEEFIIGQPPHRYLCLSRAFFESLIDQGPQAFTQTWEITCSNGTLQADVDFASQFFHHLTPKQSDRWKEGKDDRQKIDLSLFSLRTIELAIHIFKTKKYPFLSPEEQENLYRLLDFCDNDNFSKLQELLACTPPNFNRKDLQNLSWEEFLNFLEAYLQAGQNLVLIGEDCYRIEWIKAQISKLKEQGSPEVLAVRSAELYGDYGVRENIFCKISPGDLENATFSTLKLLRLRAKAKADNLELKRIKEVMQATQEVNFGILAQWHAPEAYWKTVEKELVLYPQAQWIILAGSSMRWTRAQVEAFADNKNITRQDLATPIKIALKDNENYLVKVGGDNYYKYVCRAMWKCFSGKNISEWAAIDRYAWKLCWNKVFKIKSKRYVSEVPEECQNLLSDYARKMILKR